MKSMIPSRVSGSDEGKKGNLVRETMSEKRKGGNLKQNIEIGCRAVGLNPQAV